MLPNTLEECFAHLNTMLSDADLNFIKSQKNKTTSLHHNLGRKLRNEWGLWSDSKLKEYFKKLVIFHPDDMSGIILRYFHRHLNGLPLKLEEQIKKYKEY